VRERLKGSRPDRKILEKFWCVEIGKVSRCNREVPGKLKGAALFWRGKAAFFAGGEAVGGGGNCSGRNSGKNAKREGRIGTGDSWER